MFSDPRLAMRRRERPRENSTGWSRGVSLTEVLVAILIIATGGFATLSVQRAGIRENQRTHSREVAASLARQLLESLDGIPYAPTTGTFANCLNATGGSTTYVAPCAALGPANPLDAQGQHVTSGGYTRDWSIVPNGTVAKDSPNFKTIRVRVQWVDRVPQQLIVTGIKGW